MEKLMTTFAKTKKDIIKDALEEAKRAAALENKEAKVESPKLKKRQTSRKKKIASLPWQKLDQNLLDNLNQSSNELKNLITQEFHHILISVSKKHAKLVNNFKIKLVDYINHQGRVKEILATSAKSKTELPWQKYEPKLSKKFIRFCDNLENLIIEGFDQIFEVVSHRHRDALETLKENLLAYAHKHYRNILSPAATLSKIEKKESQKDELKTMLPELSQEVTVENPSSETVPQSASSKTIEEENSPVEATQEIIVPTEK